jgi:hypothetical protein
VRRIGGLIVASAALVGCVLFTDFGEDYSDDAPQPESSDGGGGNDVSATNTPGGDDAGVADAGSDVVSGGRACATDAGQIFCADFDVGNVDDGWSALSIQSGGSVVLDDKAFASSPRSLLAKAPASAQYMQPAYLAKLFTGTFTTFSCSFSVRREEHSEAFANMVALEVYYGDNDQYFAGLSSSALGAELGINRYVNGESVATSTAAPVSFALGSWHEVRIEATTTHVKVYADGTLGASLEHELTKPPLSAEVFIGISEIQGGGMTPTTIRYDDVRCFRTL